MLLNESRVKRRSSKINSDTEQLRMRQFRSRKLFAGDWSARCTAKPMGPPDVKTTTRRLGGPGELEIDNGATERANRDIALGRGNWTFFGSDGGGRTAAVLRSFIASCKRCSVEPFA
jgi:hypothetical protein